MQSHRNILVRRCLIGCSITAVLVIIVVANSEKNADNAKVNAELMRIPSYDVDAVCKKAAYTDDEVDSDLATLGLLSAITPERRQELSEQCITQEQASFDTLKTAWPRAGDEVQTACLAKVTAPRWKFYTQLGMCLDEVSSARYAAAHPPYQAPTATFKR